MSNYRIVLCPLDGQHCKFNGFTLALRFTSDQEWSQAFFSFQPNVQICWCYWSSCTSMFIRVIARTVPQP